MLFGLSSADGQIDEAWLSTPSGLRHFTDLEVPQAIQSGVRGICNVTRGIAAGMNRKTAGGGAARKHDIDPMHRANGAPRCTAKSKRSGLPCRAPAVGGWRVFRMHGAGGGAQPGAANPNWRQGGRSAEAVALRKLVNKLGREARKLAQFTIDD